MSKNLSSIYKKPYLLQDVWAVFSKKISNKKTSIGRPRFLLAQRGLSLWWYVLCLIGILNYLPKGACPWRTSCPKGESNPHYLSVSGFWVRRVYQFRHLGMILFPSLHNFSVFLVFFHIFFSESCFVHKFQENTEEKRAITPSRASKIVISSQKSIAIHISLTICVPRGTSGASERIFS